MRYAVLPLVVIALIGLASEADAAWSPGTNAYTGTLSSVRTGLADFYGTGQYATNVSARAQKLLQKADRKLGKAQTALGLRPTWKEISRSLKFVEKALVHMKRAVRKAQYRGLTDFVYGTTGAGASLYGHSVRFVDNAAAYTVATYSSRLAARKLLKVGGYTARADRLAAKVPPRYARAMEQNRTGIRILGRNGLLD